MALGRKTASERVASFLYMIAQHIPCVGEGNNTITFDLPLTRADMADFLGLTIETVSRQLSKLKKKQIVSITHNRHIVIHDLELLQNAGQQ